MAIVLTPSAKRLFALNLFVFYTVGEYLFSQVSKKDTMWTYPRDYLSVT